MKWNFTLPLSGGAHCAVYHEFLPLVFDIDPEGLEEYVQKKTDEQVRWGTYAPSFNSGLLNVPFSPRMLKIFEQVSINPRDVTSKWEAFMNADQWRVHMQARIWFKNADDAMMLKLRWDSDTDSS